MATAAELTRLLGGADELLEKRDAGTSLPDFSEYRGRELDFQREILKWTPWGDPDKPSQRQMHGLIWSQPRVVVRSANSIGKDAQVARDALTWVFVHHGTVLITGPTQRQVRDILFRKEIAQAFHRSRLPGALYVDRLLVPGHPDLGIFGFTSSESSRLTGFHAARVMILLTEAQAVEEWSWEGLMSCATGDQDKIIAVGNPILPVGKFVDVSKSSDWAALQIPASAHPNVIYGKPIIPGGVTREWCELMAREWGEESSIYRSRVLAEFPTSSEEGLIERTWLEASADRWEAESKDPKKFAALAKYQPILAADVARFGPDATVVAIRRGHRLMGFREWRKTDTKETSGRIIKLAREQGLRMKWQDGYPGGHIVVDIIGLGAGVYDSLREFEYDVKGFNSSHQASKPAKWFNLRAEAYWHLRTLLEDGRVALPRDAELWEELLAVEWKVASSGAVQIEEKSKLKARLNRSPDKMDAVVMAWGGYSRRLTQERFRVA